MPPRSVLHRGCRAFPYRRLPWGSTPRPVPVPGWGEWGAGIPGSSPPLLEPQDPTSAPPPHPGQGRVGHGSVPGMLSHPMGDGGWWVCLPSMARHGTAQPGWPGTAALGTAVQLRHRGLAASPRARAPPSSSQAGGGQGANGVHGFSSWVASATSPLPPVLSPGRGEEK